jgi:hypothetical protein
MSIKKSSSFKIDVDQNGSNGDGLSYSIYENNRPIFTEKDLRERYSFSKIASNDALKGGINYVAKKYRPSRVCLLNFLFERIPFISWIQTYDVKTNLLKDIIAGLTIGN